MRTAHPFFFQDSARLKAFLLLLFLSLFVFNTVEAKSLDELKAGAENGSIEDQYNLGEKYLHGKDYKNARKWLGKAAEKGNVPAQTKMGWLYEHGKGVKKDYGIAFSWYEKAANQGDSYAQRPLGKFYELGLGVDPAPEKAFYWYEKAAQQGIARAQANLGILYETGAGVGRDYEKAVFWYKKTTEQGYPRGQYLLGKMYERGLGVEKNIAVAKQWYRKSASSKYSRAIKRLRTLAAKGQDKSKADQNKKPSLSIQPKQAKKIETDSQKASRFFDDPSVLTMDLANTNTMDRSEAISVAQKHFFKGNSLVENGQLREGVLEYKRALVYDPGSANALANLGITYFELGKKDEGIKLMHDSIAAKPNNSKTYASLGMMLQATKRDRDALVQYQKAIKNNPTIKDIYFFMAVIFTNLHDYDRAWKSLHMADVFGYQDQELRQILLSVSKEPELSWPEDENGYHLRQIIVATQEKAQEIRGRLLSGADFSALVESDGLEKYRENDGYMGYLEINEISPNVLKIIKNLSPFSYSDILETDKGFHIFQRLVVLKELSDLVR